MKCTDSASARPEGAICSYSGYLLVPSLGAETGQQVVAAANAAGLEVDVGDTSIEFEFEGRDTNQFVVEFLKHLASLIGTATGEIRCEIEGNGDPCFEFFKIQDSRLIRQRAALVREPEEDLSEGRTRA